MWIDLGLRATRCANWRWLPGMLPMWSDNPGAECGRVAAEVMEAHPALVPDFRDPATVGCLLALVREAWGDGSFCARTLGGWSVWSLRLADPRTSSRVGNGPTEAEALVAALEAAP